MIAEFGCSSLLIITNGGTLPIDFLTIKMQKSSREWFIELKIFATSFPCVNIRPMVTMRVWRAFSIFSAYCFYAPVVFNPVDYTGCSAL